ncbi:regulatory protein RecX [Sphingomonas abietis]|uniref:RecX family transcriptional regulator n=1 Tax=Sphingomonas abietis TaxID=3012344 RepID=A0ABY7NJF7_9SPHN|nr:RecX family transcriptional regulator [Sphingomonas abietis]WBO21656.1 RecX family transcriptional regulator [Sphingomonas abietis]
MERLAIGYVSRYATSRAKLRDYLRRKLAERGWDGESEAPIEPLVTRFADLGYVDDRAVADARGRALAARGYGARRLGQALSVLGIGDGDAGDARQHAADVAWQTALRFAERRRFGPFARDVADDADRRRAFGAMVRAGHAPEHIRKILACRPGDVPEQDGS